MSPPEALSQAGGHVALSHAGAWPAVHEELLRGRAAGVHQEHRAQGVPWWPEWFEFPAFTARPGVQSLVWELPPARLAKHRAPAGAASSVGMRHWRLAVAGLILWGWGGLSQACVALQTHIGALIKFPKFFRFLFLIRFSGQGSAGGVLPCPCSGSSPHQA